MYILNDLINKGSSLSVIGLGYVGLPLSICFSEKIKVIGFDININKIDLYQKGIDPTGQFNNDTIKNSLINFTYNESTLQEANFHIITVPTPINLDKTPNLEPIINASVILGRNLKRDSIVVYESTVYPGVTEDICKQILERESGLSCGKDFKIGYSPERINLGDKYHHLENIKKIVSGMDKETLEIIASVYELIITVGVYKAPSIKVAEAAKVVENSQRDINIAFMNEMAMAFEKMSIDTIDVIEAMNTKWNALNFSPGLVGGHCIGIDPYYFVYQANRLGFHSKLIMTGREINNSVGKHIAEIIIKKLILAKKSVINSKVVVFGITFKENCPDCRNSKVIDIVCNLKEFGVIPVVVDPLANKDEVKNEYDLIMSNFDDIYNADCLVFAVAHKEFRDMNYNFIDSLFKSMSKNEKIIIDIKGILNKNFFINSGYIYWRF